MSARELFFFSMVFWAGCSAPKVSQDLPLDHPANPAAPETEFHPPPNVLATQEEISTPSEAGGSQGGHESHHGQHSEGTEHAGKGADGYPLSVCVVSGETLGSMGEPVVIQHEGREVRFCCKSCVEKFRKDPDKYLKKLDEAKKAKEAHGAAHEPPGTPGKEGPVPEHHH